MAQNYNIGTLGQSLVVNTAANTVGLTSTLVVGNSTVNSTVNATGFKADFGYTSRQNLPYNYTVGAIENTLVVGPITINNGITLTVSDGGRLVII
jgi:hypothetical protein